MVGLDRARAIPKVRGPTAEMNVLWSRPFAAAPTTVTTVASQRRAIVCDEREHAEGLVEELNMNTGDLIWRLDNRGGLYQAMPIP